MYEIPFFSVRDAPQELKDKWLDVMRDQIELGELIGGSAVANFEIEWSRFNKLNHSVGVGNGYDGLRLSLLALGIGVGSKVAVPAHTFIATWLAIQSVGAIPVGIDVDELGLIDLNQLENLEVNVDAVIPVHMHGTIVNMKRLSQWASSRGIFVIEDASQCHGESVFSLDRNYRGDLIVFSLYPTKNLGALGDAGIVSTNNLTLAKVLQELRDYGRENLNRNKMSRVGVNSRLDPIQARVLEVNLSILEDSNRHRKKIAQHYLSELAAIGVKPLHAKIENSVYHHFAILDSNRDALKIHLENKGIQTEIHYLTTAASLFSQISKTNVKKYPTAERICQTTLSLPCNQWMSLDKADRVIQEIKNFFKNV